MKKLQPIALMSYVHSDDEHDRGRITEIRARISGEVKAQSGEEFPIFQDREDIKGGQNWEKRINESLDACTFLIPIITPSFFKSDACRKELHRFIKREKDLGRDDLILPIYYIGCSLLDDEEKRSKDKLAQVIAAHQWADFRDLRFEPLTGAVVCRAIERLAVDIRDALERTAEAGSAVDAPAPKAEASPRASKAVEQPDDPACVTPAVEMECVESAAGDVESRRGPSAKTEPPTRIVDPMSPDACPTISEAIEAASPGDRILVRPGHYNEGLVIDKPLEIIGDGAPGEVVIETKGKSCVAFQATMGRITNLTLRQTGGEPVWHGVIIGQGRLEMEDCDVTSNGGSCVLIHGGADPRLRRNRIHEGKSAGVITFDNGRGVLEDNDIFGHSSPCVVIADGGNPTLRRNRIHDGKDDGVHVCINGQGVLEDNDIFDNKAAGIGVRDGGRPRVLRNRVNRNGAWGVKVRHCGAGTFSGNDLRDNKLGPCSISGDSWPNVTRSGNIE